MKDEIQRTEATQSSEVQEEELEQAAGGLVGYGDHYVVCPNCNSPHGVIKSDLPKFKYKCTFCRMPFNL